MNSSLMFTIANSIALLSWFVLIITPNQNKVIPYLRVMISGLFLGGLYIFALSLGFGKAEGNFSSLESVRSLFTNDEFLLAGWVHYLSFDLFIGTWEAEDGKSIGIHRLYLVPIHFLTFYYGPVGLVLYLIVKVIKTKRFGF
ncbi:ABA4-like family protein [Leptospira paudalimensis]|uniref:ABA4-like family protein n=1 Tax=Leptospira paudalimensis TaxID=2950024 RepID=A0ABT3M430_9LEPT|nr:ABA4-like family protein [Leptospira paudalimensis]MCW7502756.1 ABA4-like family protein [Leptospira paudalimensis]